MNRRIVCRIAGRVQMVMYRDFATRTARKLGIVGDVHNEADKTVLVVAEGQVETLKSFVEQLNIGSVFSRVEAVEVSWGDATGEFSDFHIRY